MAARCPSKAGFFKAVPPHEGRTQESQFVCVVHTSCLEEEINSNLGLPPCWDCGCLRSCFTKQKSPSLSSLPHVHVSPCQASLQHPWINTRTFLLWLLGTRGAHRDFIWFMWAAAGGQESAWISPLDKQVAILSNTQLLSVIQSHSVTVFSNSCLGHGTWKTGKEESPVSAILSCVFWGSTWGAYPQPLVCLLQGHSKSLPGKLPWWSAQLSPDALCSCPHGGEAGGNDSS